MVYGNSRNKANELRTFTNGLLFVQLIKHS
jgi:hypothetical protein